MDTTAVAMETTQTIGWPTQAEAARALGVSVKTVQKYVEQGRLAQRMQPQINKPARAVIEPIGLERMVRERSSIQVANHSSEGVANGSALRVANPSSPTLDLRELFGSREPSIADLAHKLWLTEDEAVAYTGLGRGYLRSRLEPQRIGPRGAAVYRRVELESL